MRFMRKLLAIIVVLGMVLALVPKTASAAGPAWPTAADVRKDQADYLKSLEGDSSYRRVSTHATGLVVDGFQIPPDVAAMKTFKDGYVRVLVTVPGDTLSSYALKQSKSLAHMTRYEASGMATMIRNARTRSSGRSRQRGSNSSRSGVSQSCSTATRHWSRRATSGSLRRQLARRTSISAGCSPWRTLPATP